VIVLMLWFYLAGLVILVGAEIDAINEAGSTKPATARAQPGGTTDAPRLNVGKASALR
jgi:uncharacterized BrkB/YihY/UPF0761 family membrane protein